MIGCQATVYVSAWNNQHFHQHPWRIYLNCTPPFLTSLQSHLDVSTKPEITLPATHQKVIMATIKCWSKATSIQRHTSSLTHQPKWQEGRWLREFSVRAICPLAHATRYSHPQKSRFVLLPTIPTSPQPNEAEREALTRMLMKWVRESKEWWGGTWDDADLADWHVNQHVKGKRHVVG